MSDNLDDVETTVLGVSNDGEPVSSAPPVTESPAPVVPEVPPVVEDDVEYGIDGNPVLDETGAPKRKGGFQRRIDKLNAKLQEKERELEFMRRYQPPPVAPVQPVVAPPVVATTAPQRDNFNSMDEYLDAVVKHTAEVTQSRMMQQLEQQKRQQTIQEVDQKFQQQLQTASTKYKDFNEVLSESTAPSTDTMGAVIKKSEAAVDLMYFLAKNPEVAVQIASLPDAIDQARALGVLEGNLKYRSSTPPKVSAAPPPISPVQGMTPNVSRPVSGMDGDEYLAFMRAKAKR